MKYISFIMMNGFTYTFEREQLAAHTDLPGDDTMILRHLHYVTADTNGGGILTLNMEHCAAVECFDKFPEKIDEAAGSA